MCIKHLNTRFHIILTVLARVIISCPIMQMRELRQFAHRCGLGPKQSKPNSEVPKHRAAPAPESRAGVLCPFELAIQLLWA